MPFNNPPMNSSSPQVSEAVEAAYDEGFADGASGGSRDWHNSHAKEALQSARTPSGKDMSDDVARVVEVLDWVGDKMTVDQVRAGLTMNEVRARAICHRLSGEG